MPTAAEIGSLAGDYRIVAAIGAGGWGEVYKAEHVITRRIDAIKFLKFGGPAKAEAEQRYLREVQVQASLRHPNIAAVHTAFWTPQGLALVMELVDGEPLDAILARGRLPLPTGVGYVLQTLAALEYAHALGVIHRDVKPANILITPDAVAKLTDFGLARRIEGPHLTNSGALAGSPYYMSPEQVVGLAPADPRSDIYAVGVILYEIAAGCRPFEDESAFQVMLQHRDAVPVPPSRVKPGIGSALDAVILKALEKDPAHRFQSAAEFRLAIEAALAEIPAPPAMRAGRRWGIAAVLAVAATGLALSGAKYLEPKPAPAPPAMPTPRLPVPALAEPKPLAEAAPAPEPASPEPPLKARPVRNSKTALAVMKPARQAYSVPAIPEPPRLPAARVSTEPPLPPPASVPVSNEATPKRRNAVWRALGRLVRGKGGTPAAEATQPPRGQPAPAYAQPAPAK